MVLKAWPLHRFGWQSFFCSFQGGWQHTPASLNWLQHQQQLQQQRRLLQHWRDKPMQAAAATTRRVAATSSLCQHLLRLTQ
jgi:DNA mismatch repair ATPase MutS